MEETFQKYETRLIQLKKVCDDQVPPFWIKLLHRSISACDMHTNTLDGFRVKIATFERHLIHVLELKPHWLCVQEQFLKIQQEFNSLPKDVPRTSTLCQVIRNGMRHFLSTSSCFSKEALYSSLEKLQMDLDRLVVAIENRQRICIKRARAEE